MTTTTHNACARWPLCPVCGPTPALGGHFCDKCSVFVPLDEYHGNDKPDGTSEYLCPDCPTDYPEED